MVDKYIITGFCLRMLLFCGSSCGEVFSIRLHYLNEMWLPMGGPVLGGCNYCPIFIKLFPTVALCGCGLLLIWIFITKQIYFLIRFNIARFFFKPI